MNTAQLSLFETRRNLPAGLAYQEDFLAATEERDLLSNFAGLAFKEFEFHGFRGKRRVVSFGWRYDFTRQQLQRTADMPAFLLPLREKAARFANIPPERLQQVLLAEYAPGAGIGWHKDRSVFGQVVGISLVSTCVFRLRRKMGARWERASLVAQPRSAYLLQGPSRSEWEHSIPPVERLRYSVTFRSFRDSA